MAEQFVWTFPGGKKGIEKDTGIAGNVATTLTVPAAKRWLLVNVRMTLTTDATVVNRYACVRTRDSADAMEFDNIANSVAASQTAIDKYFVRGLSSTGGAINGLGYGLLAPGEDVYLTVSGGVAGDSYDYLVAYLEIDAP